jgi:hypothetical protein
VQNALEPRGSHDFGNDVCAPADSNSVWEQRLSFARRTGNRRPRCKTMGFARGQRGIMRRLPRECREWPCITQLIYARIARILVGDVDRSIFLFVCTDIFLAGVGK